MKSRSCTITEKDSDDEEMTHDEIESDKDILKINEELTCWK